jgi:hypothetical protein
MIRSPRSIRALLFLPLGDKDGDDDRGQRTPHQHLTRRDQQADSLEDLLDFDRSPSLHTPR